MKLGFIGFGGAGHGLAKGLKQAGVDGIHFYDRMQDTPPYAETIGRRAEEIGAVRAATIQDLLSRVEILISCVTGAMAVSVAKEAAPFLGGEHLWADVNTAAPAVKEEVAGIVGKTGAHFADAAMMGAIPAYLHRVPILASGPAAEKFQALMQPYGMNIRIIGDKPGQASAIKLFRSIFMKGLLSLLLELLPATHRYGVDQTVLGSTKGVVNAERMAHEMEEVIATLDGMDLPAEMSRAAREKLLWCAGLGLRERFEGEPPSTLAEVLQEMEMVPGGDPPEERR